MMKLANLPYAALLIAFSSIFLLFMPLSLLVFPLKEPGLSPLLGASMAIIILIGGLIKVNNMGWGMVADSAGHEIGIMPRLFVLIFAAVSIMGVQASYGDIVYAVGLIVVAALIELFFRAIHHRIYNRIYTQLVSLDITEKQKNEHRDYDIRRLIDAPVSQEQSSSEALPLHDAAESHPQPAARLFRLL